MEPLYVEPERAGVPSRSTRSLRVALVNMPFASTRYPSIQLGLLRAILDRRGFDVTTHHLNLRLAASIGWETYEVICHTRSNLLGEWLFARAAFMERAPEGAAYLGRFSEETDRLAARAGRDRDFLLRLREELAPAFIRDCVESIAWDQYDVVGFGSVFEQNCAVLAMARALKQRYPDLVTVCGGANFEDEMGIEYMRAFPWVDYAVIGEGDEVFPALLDRLASGDVLDTMPGVARRTADGSVAFAGRAPLVGDLDALPEPDYREFFEEVARLDVPDTAQGRIVVLPFETARGCWWGQKHHCTFCGLNGAGMAYRSKSPARTLAGLDELARRHHVYAFEAVDNILDHRYIREVFVPLTEQHKDYTFFYEVKANLTQEQLRTLARGGVRQLQPGIESLSTHVLKLMRKGTTGILNVRFLKWARYYGLRVGWNLLSGFPGELAEDYAQQLATLKLIPHLQPPTGGGRIWLERYSPNFESAGVLGFTSVRAVPAYACIYPRALDFDRIAYFFDYDAGETLPEEAHTPTREWISAWQAMWQGDKPPYLLYQRGAGRLTVIDGREPGAPRVHLFDEHAALTYEFCTPTYHSAGQIVARLGAERGVETDHGAVQRALDDFAALGLMLAEDGHYLSLALPVNPNW